MKVAIYLRVSTEEQGKKGISLDAQEDRLRQFSKSKNYEIFDVYKDVSSAKNDKRKDFQRMFSDAQQKKFDIILVFKLDRFMRNLRQFLFYFDEFEKYGVQFASLMENFDTSTPMGRAVIKMVAIFAELERDMISQRAIEIREFQSKGTKAINRPPFGYKVNKRSKKYELDEENYGKVIQIFDLFLSGKSLNDLSQQYGSTRQGIRNILTNKNYTNPMKDRPIIIDVETFDKVQKKINEKKIPKYLST